jgi:argininosuccinate lyase
MQIAMPSTVGLWMAAFAEELLDDLRLARTAYSVNDSSPLGAAAGYGVSLPLDRERIAESLAFQRVQNNVLYVTNSRGKLEALVLDAASEVMLTLSRLAQDLIIFSMPEFGYFSLPEEVCTGSSIMPQKRNPDVLELVRAKTASILAYSHQIKTIVCSLPSGYNRDIQETKWTLLDGTQTALSSVGIMNLVMEGLVVHEKNLLAGFKPEIFAADRVLDMVALGSPFREAYLEVKTHLEELGASDPREAVDKKSYRGAPGNLGLELSRQALLELTRKLEEEQKRVSKRLAALVGKEVRPF